MTPLPSLKPEGVEAGLTRIFAEAIVNVAARAPELRGPWRFDEADLQSQAEVARKWLSDHSSDVRNMVEATLPSPPEDVAVIAAALRLEVEYDNDEQDGPREITYGRVFEQAATLLLEVAAERDRLATAMAKIDAIRNSIIGFQALNWSEHIYPLVAALGEAGYEGAGYKISRANVGTLLEQIAAAEASASSLREALKPFAEGSVDVSNTAIIVDGSAREAIDSARAAITGGKEP